MAVAIAMAFASAAGAQLMLFVDDDAPPGGNGLAWATAFNSLQDALDAAPRDPRRAKELS